jgi:hypothetical protein
MAKKQARRLCSTDSKELAINNKFRLKRQEVAKAAGLPLCECGGLVWECGKCGDCGKCYDRRTQAS